MAPNNNWDVTKNPRAVIVEIEDYEVVDDEERFPGWYWGMAWTDPVTDDNQVGNDDLIALPEYDQKLYVLNGPYSLPGEAEQSAQYWWINSGERLFKQQDA